MSSPIIASDFFDDYDPAPAQCPDYEGTSLEELTPKTVDTLTRLVDFANVELLTTRYYRLLRANKPDQYKTDTEGDIFCQLHHDVWESWLESEQQELLKDTHPQVTDRWRYFVERELGLSEFKNWKRYLTLLSNDTWRACAADWTSYDMGRATFKVHQFTDAASLFLDEFFVPLFTNTLRKLDKSLGAWSKRILADDLKLLTQLKEPYHNLDTLRELAFPLQEDDPKSKFGTNKAWFIGSAEYTT
ncbi:hypothetical protein EDD37DRAFT_494093 [Exophiala viscosa]|uniref:uncharacterized protein n=1 Tax=Exophiala viscosa TaxID=2486360 RepID=UPI00219EDFD9|nr:hypothetical protein EDD37DRAFT_494093 [Exophiala viscosa]